MILQYLCELVISYFVKGIKPVTDNYHKYVQHETLLFKVVTRANSIIIIFFFIGFPSLIMYQLIVETLLHSAGKELTQN